MLRHAITPARGGGGRSRRTAATAPRSLVSVATLVALVLSALAFGALPAQAEPEAATEEPAAAESVEAESTQEPEPESSPEAAPVEEKPKPVSSGEAHQPRTDADIDGTESLFDL